MEREKIIKALECCNKTREDGMPTIACDECPCFIIGSMECKNLERYALSLIKELTEKNERLHASCTELEQTCKKWQSRLDIECKYTKADTVKVMQERLTSCFCPDCDYSGHDVQRVIDQIAKEMLEGEQ